MYNTIILNINKNQIVKKEWNGIYIKIDNYIENMVFIEKDDISKNRYRKTFVKIHTYSDYKIRDKNNKFSVVKGNKLAEILGKTRKKDNIEEKKKLMKGDTDKKITKEKINDKRRDKIIKENKEENHIEKYIDYNKKNQNNSNIFLKKFFANKELICNMRCRDDMADNIILILQMIYTIARYIYYLNINNESLDKSYVEEHYENEKDTEPKKEYVDEKNIIPEYKDDLTMEENIRDIIKMQNIVEEKVKNIKELLNSNLISKEVYEDLTNLLADMREVLKTTGNQLSKANSVSNDLNINKVNDKKYYSKDEVTKKDKVQGNIHIYQEVDNPLNCFIGEKTKDGIVRLTKNIQKGEEKDAFKDILKQMGAVLEKGEKTIQKNLGVTLDIGDMLKK